MMVYMYYSNSNLNSLNRQPGQSSTQSSSLIRRWKLEMSLKGVVQNRPCIYFFYLVFCMLLAVWTETGSAAPPIRRRCSAAARKVSHLSSQLALRCQY